jgi:hypothetical protein
MATESISAAPATRANVVSGQNYAIQSGNVILKPGVSVILSLLLSPGWQYLCEQVL